MKTQLHNLKLLISITLLLLSTIAFAQQGINYQGIARDADNELITNTDITLDVNIVKTSIVGETVYSETHTTITDASGVFSIEIGDGTPILNQFVDIIWAENRHFLNVWLNGTEIGTTQFAAVPYAKSTEAFGKWVVTDNGVESENTGGSIFIGTLAGHNDDLTNNRNIAMGDQALKDNVIGFRNIALGSLSLNSKIEGNDNISIGGTALFENIEGHRNVAIGKDAGRNNLGDDNVFIGPRAGRLEIGSDRLYISNNDNTFPLIYGEFDNEVIAFNAKTGIGTQSPTVPLHITSGNEATLINGTGKLLLGEEFETNLVIDNNEIQARNNGIVSTLNIQPHGGNVNIGGAVSVQGSVVHDSDKRLKRDIVDISYGLKDVLQLRPTEYFWKAKTQDHKSLGLIAQEVDEVIKNVVTYDEKQDKYGVSYTELIPVLIKAIQEQQHIIETQQNKNDNQSKKLFILETRIKIIEATLLEANNGAN